MNVQITDLKELENYPLLLHVEDLIPILGIGRVSAYKLVRTGQIRCVRIGRHIRIPRNAVEQFVQGVSA